jgi:DNA-directed RNA polymerases I, II, and III subunit RPABC2
MADEEVDVMGAMAGEEDVAEDIILDEEDEDAGGAKANKNEIAYYHPEVAIDYLESVLPKVQLQVAPPVDSAEKDPNHTSLPFLTVYERTKILGTRANQIADGARAFVKVPDHVIDPLEIAKLELEQRRLPFILKRPMPDGTFEYWRLSDLMIL